MTTATETSKQERIEALCAITGGKPEWYDTKKKRSMGEIRAGLEWDGTNNVYKRRGQDKIVKMSSGTWCWERMIGAGTRANVAMTAAECLANGRTPGPANV